MNGEADHHDKHDRSRGNRGSNSRRLDGRERAGGRTSCKGFVTDRTRRCDGDNNDSDNYGGDNERRRLGNLTGASFWGFDEEGPVRRERTRSPPRRDYTYRGHDNEPAVLHRLFAEALQCNPPTVDPEPRRSDGLDFISRAHRLLDRVDQNASGNDTWSGMVPLVRVFNTLRTSLHQPSPADNGHNLDNLQPAPSVEVTAALSDLELQHQLLGAEGTTLTATTPVQAMPPRDDDDLQGVYALFSTPLRPSYSSRRHARPDTIARST
jgi:hypothetical protein